MKLHQRIPAIVDAIQFDGTPEMAAKIKDAYPLGGIVYEIWNNKYVHHIRIQTSEGWIAAKELDWIVKDEYGKLRVYKPNDFESLYEPICSNEQANKVKECLLSIEHIEESFDPYLTYGFENNDASKLRKEIDNIKSFLKEMGSDNRNIHQQWRKRV